jgi:aspartate-semialdehyde dehydrogenase
MGSGKTYGGGAYMQKYNVAILGATGLVGRKVFEILLEREFPIGDLRLLATSRTAGTKIDVGDRQIEVTEVQPNSFDGVDICFFAASASASRELAPVAVSKGAVVIDKSNAFRMDDNVPLVVPEVNPNHLKKHNGIIASPNCSTIQMVVAIKPIEDAVGLERIIVSTYQSVSGTGKEAIEELTSQTADLLSSKKPTLQIYPKQIAFNLLPHIDNFLTDDYTGEEWKMISETQKILDRPDLKVTATCVRVPVYVGHSEAVLIETKEYLSPEEARDLLKRAPSVKVIDEPEQSIYPVPSESEGKDDVFVGRIRRDVSSKNGLWMWVVSDNLRKGAATNAVQIAETLVEQGLLFNKK